MTNISVTVEGSDPGRVDFETRQLLGEIKALRVPAEFAPGEAPPPDSKGWDPATVSTIIASLAASPVLVRLGRVLQDWVNRDRHRALTIKDGNRTVTIKGRATDQELAAVKDFFTREIE
ncbi:hypothetical protein [Actinosynnema sp. NPDC020468]|uniref:hypothetical protein n=1 Tax=Actinosynnema sp. NPDC020468 TaxID=3154488 RepID=UPI0033C44D85